MRIKTVTVVGANGSMGACISGLFASFGDAKVYMVCRDLEKARTAIYKAIKSVRADSIKTNLVPADYSMLAECVKKSDLVFESTAENLEIKKDITARIADSLRVDAVACSGTSGLSITVLAECLPLSMRGNYFGVHMFNPPYSMTLCEIIPTKYSSPSLLAELKKYMQETLLRTIVEVKDSPAFLANRIGFQFINEALQYAERYKDNGGIDYIDSILGVFSGRSMPPLVTADFVGLDVHKAIVENVHNNTMDYENFTFTLPAFVQRLIDEGKLGRKAGEGLYKQVLCENGKKRHLVYDINTHEYRDRINYAFPFAEEMKQALKTGDYERAFQILITNRSLEAEICLRFLLNYIVYALTTATKVGYNLASADDVMAMGFNWCPPQALIQAFSLVTNVRQLLKDRLPTEIIAAVDIDVLLSRVERSKYDYRPYFKSNRQGV